MQHPKGHYRKRKLKPEAQDRLDRFLPVLEMEAVQARNPESLWDKPRSHLCLEVGYGGGEVLAPLVKSQPDWGFIGCEPYANGTAKFLLSFDQPPPNLRLYAGNGTDILAHLPSACLDRFILLYPDPWPKSRHAKHRFIQSDVVADLARTLKSGAEVLFASDDPQLVAWVLAHFLAHPSFIWEKTLHPRADSLTRYEAKALLEKKFPCRLVFRKK